MAVVAETLRSTQRVSRTPQLSPEQNGHSPNGATHTLDVIAADDGGSAEDVLAPIEGGKGWPFEGSIFPDTLRIPRSSRSRNGHRAKEKDFRKPTATPTLETVQPERRIQRRQVGIIRST